MPEIKLARVDGVGQLNKGDLILMVCGKHRRVESHKVREVYNKGDTFEVVTYKKNKTFNFSPWVVVASESWVKEVYIVQDLQ